MEALSPNQRRELLSQLLEWLSSEESGAGEGGGGRRSRRHSKKSSSSHHHHRSRRRDKDTSEDGRHPRERRRRRRDTASASSSSPEPSDDRRHRRHRRRQHDTVTDAVHAQLVPPPAAVAPVSAPPQPRARTHSPEPEAVRPTPQAADAAPAGARQQKRVAAAGIIAAAASSYASFAPGRDASQSAAPPPARQASLRVRSPSASSRQRAPSASSRTRDASGSAVHPPWGYGAKTSSGSTGAAARKPLTSTTTPKRTPPAGRRRSVPAPVMAPEDLEPGTEAEPEPRGQQGVPAPVPYVTAAAVVSTTAPPAAVVERRSRSRSQSRARSASRQARARSRTRSRSPGHTDREGVDTTRALVYSPIIGVEDPDSPPLDTFGLPVAAAGRYSRSRSPRSRGGGAGRAIWNRLYRDGLDDKHRRTRLARDHAVAKETAVIEDPDCTFRPETNSRHYADEDLKDRPERVFHHLHADSTARRRRIEELRRGQEADEQRTFTFQPIVNQNPQAVRRDLKTTPYEKSYFEKLFHEAQQRRERQHDLEKKARETREYRRVTRSTPESLDAFRKRTERHIQQGAVEVGWMRRVYTSSRGAGGGAALHKGTDIESLKASIVTDRKIKQVMALPRDVWEKLIPRTDFPRLLDLLDTRTASRQEPVGRITWDEFAEMFHECTVEAYVDPECTHHPVLDKIHRPKHYAKGGSQVRSASQPHKLSSSEMAASVTRLSQQSSVRSASQPTQLGGRREGGQPQPFVSTVRSPSGRYGTPPARGAAVTPRKGRTSQPPPRDASPAAPQPRSAPPATGSALPTATSATSSPSQPSPRGAGHSVGWQTGASQAGSYVTPTEPVHSGVPPSGAAPQGPAEPVGSRPVSSEDSFTMANPDVHALREVSEAPEPSAQQPVPVAQQPQPQPQPGIPQQQPHDGPSHSAFGTPVIGFDDDDDDDDEFHTDEDDRSPAGVFQQQQQQQHHAAPAPRPAVQHQPTQPAVATLPQHPHHAQAMRSALSAAAPRAMVQKAPTAAPGGSHGGTPPAGTGGVAAATSHVVRSMAHATPTPTPTSVASPAVGSDAATVGSLPPPPQQHHQHHYQPTPDPDPQQQKTVKALEELKKKLSATGGFYSLAAGGAASAASAASASAAAPAPLERVGSLSHTPQGVSHSTTPVVGGGSVRGGTPGAGGAGRGRGVAIPTVVAGSVQRTPQEVALQPQAQPQQAAMRAAVLRSMTPPARQGGAVAPDAAGGYLPPAAVAQGPPQVVPVHAVHAPAVGTPAAGSGTTALPVKVPSKTPAKAPVKQAVKVAAPMAKSPMLPPQGPSAEVQYAQTYPPAGPPAVKQTLNVKRPPGMSPGLSVQSDPYSVPTAPLSRGPPVLTPQGTPAVKTPSMMMTKQPSSRPAQAPPSAFRAASRGSSDGTPLRGSHKSSMPSPDAGQHPSTPRTAPPVAKGPLPNAAPPGFQGAPSQQPTVHVQQVARPQVANPHGGGAAGHTNTAPQPVHSNVSMAKKIIRRCKSCGNDKNLVKMCPVTGKEHKSAQGGTDRSTICGSCGNDTLYMPICPINNQPHQVVAAGYGLG